MFINVFENIDHLNPNYLAHIILNLTVFCFLNNKNPSNMFCLLFVIRNKVRMVYNHGLIDSKNINNVTL